MARAAKLRVMSQVVAGISLILLAALVIFAAVIEMAGGDLRRDTPPLFELEPSQKPADDQLVVTMGRGEAISGAGLSHEIDGEVDIDVSNLGELTAEERQRVDARSYLHHRIRKGETLSALSSRYLGDLSKWKKIVEHNPHLGDERGLSEGRIKLREGTVIKIPLFLRGR